MLSHSKPQISVAPLKPLPVARASDCPRLPHEVSDTVTPATIAYIARTGVDLISVGELTHSVRAADLSMRIEAF
jgi:nicotinate-nucleotide pyrophosphorylase